MTDINCIMFQFSHSDSSVIYSMKELCAGLTLNGIEIAYTVDNKTGIENFVNSYIASCKPGSTINFIGINHFPKPESGSPPPHIKEIRHFSWVVDNLAHHFQKLDGIDANTHFAFVDESHLEVCNTINFINPISFLPHAGPQPNNDPAPFIDRKIDFLFTGSLEEPMTQEKLLSANPAVPSFIMEIIVDASKLLSCSRISSLEALRISSGKHQVYSLEQFEKNTLLHILQTIEQLAQQLRRRDVLLAIDPKHSLFIAADHLPAYLHDRPNLNFLGRIDFSSICELYKNTRIILNPVSKFSHGSHERIWFGMASGAVIATDDSNFVGKDFEHGKSIIFLPWGSETKDYKFLNSLVSNYKLLKQISEAATPIYSKNHTWEKRSRHIIKMLREK